MPVSRHFSLLYPCRGGDYRSVWPLYAHAPSYKTSAAVSPGGEGVKFHSYLVQRVSMAIPRVKCHFYHWKVSSILQYYSFFFLIFHCFYLAVVVCCYSHYFIALLFVTGFY